ncbi:MAG: amidophosphoribosyltransferase [Candidatus Bathyarchaeota archaeon]
MSPREKCGVFGAYSPDKDVFPLLYWGMLAQNHRGHHSHGFATCGDGVESYTSLGLIPTEKAPGGESPVRVLGGRVGVANVRYATSGSSGVESLVCDAMPLVLRGERRCVAISFNGNIVNVRDLQERVGADRGSSDTHALGMLMLQTLEQGGGIGDAARACMEGVDGSYSIVGVTEDGTLFAFKDPVGVKPLCYGAKDGVHAFSSESVGLDINGLEHDHELIPGELMTVKDGDVTREQVLPWRRQAFCAFEFAYFARPDSRFNGKYVYQARVDFGKALARGFPDRVNRCDVCVGIPETANDAAYGFHLESGLPWEQAARRHRFVTQRAFISAADERADVIRRKVNLLGDMVRGKYLAVVDDSIVRGDTTRGTVKRFRDAGANEVHLFITYPRITGPCFYGIDMASYSELIGARMGPEEIAAEVGADSVSYLSVEDYVRKTGMPRNKLCLGCVTGEYPTPLANRLSREMRDRLRRGKSERGRIYES